MKKHKNKSKPRKSNNANAVLNEVGGVVELKWEYDKDYEKWTTIGTFEIVRQGYLRFHEAKTFRWEYRLMRFGKLIQVFNKLTSAKLVAQLINNG